MKAKTYIETIVFSDGFSVHHNEPKTFDEIKEMFGGEFRADLEYKEINRGFMLIDTAGIYIYYETL